MNLLFGMPSRAAVVIYGTNVSQPAAGDFSHPASQNLATRNKTVYSKLSRAKHIPGQSQA